MYPVDEHGTALGENADIIEDPNELLDRRLDYAVEISKGEIRPDLCRDTYCQYSLATEDNEVETFNTVTVF